jgi:hypothetical protein
MLVDIEVTRGEESHELNATISFTMALTLSPLIRVTAWVAHVYNQTTILSRIDSRLESLI